MFQFTSGSVLGRYELLVPIASGGMAEVWAARLHGTRGFTKLVAIKTIRRGVMDDARLEQMLMAEAQLASRIDHPNVISTLELGEQENTLFLVMEWADAEPLSHLHRESGKLPLSVAVNLIAQACKGAHAAHELTDEDGNVLGVVHRDISPQNVLVTYGGVVKLVDFGIAKATQRSSSMTEDGEVKGKLAYMSPEQGKGETVDRRTDVFALGTLLYLLTTGHHPFKGESPGETLAKLFSESPLLPPSRFDPDYPAALDAIVLKCLSKDRERRYSTAHELLEALDEALPESRGIEDEVAEFVRSVCRERGEKRRRHIRAAGELLDRRHGNALAAASSTSLSAMSLGETKSPPAPPSAAPRPSIPDFRPKATLRWVAGAAATAGLAVGLLFAASDPSEPSTGGALSQAPLPLSAFSAPLTPSRSAQPKPSTSSTSASPSPTQSATADVAREPRQHGDAVDSPRRRGEGTSAKGRRAPKPATTEASASPVSSRPEASPAGKPPARKQRTKDSWDPSTFGGRL